MDSAIFVQVTAPWTRSKQIIEKSWEYGKDLLACFVEHMI